jgi:3-hydroxy-9,10-secoandrosta-1,3,5(10)-triene-9,17-dione monooxygenase
MSMTDIAEAAGLWERVEALVPLLRANALRTERDGRVAPENIDALAQAGVFRMTAPRAFGGYQVPVTTQVDVLAAVGRGCGSTSWVCAVYSVGVWMVGCFSDQAQEEVFAAPDARVTLVAAPTGTLTPTNDGYQLTGRWGFNTGCLDSHWAIVGAPRPADEDAGGKDGMVALVPYADLEIADDWNVSGLCGTGSRTIIAEDLFVPAHRVLAMSEAQSGHHRSERHAADPYYRTPIGALANANSAGTPLGLGQAALELFLAQLPGKAITLTSHTDRRLAAITHLQVGEAAVKLESAAFHAARCAELVDASCRTEEALTIRDRAQIRSDLGYVTDLSRGVAHLLLEGSGASAIHNEVPIQRIVRDLDALAQHAVLHPKTNLELYGRVLCGLEPHSVAI